jgi:hypothetical protein
MTTSARTLRPHFGVTSAHETSRSDTPDARPRGASTALRWLIVPALGLAVYAALRRRASEPKTQFMSSEWLRANGHRRQYEI